METKTVSEMLYLLKVVLRSGTEYKTIRRNGTKCHILARIPFTTSESTWYYYHQKVTSCVTDWRTALVKILINYELLKKSLKCLELVVNYPAGNPKVVKHVMDKPTMSFIFWICLQHLVQGCLREYISISNLTQAQ